MFLLITVQTSLFRPVVYGAFDVMFFEKSFHRMLDVVRHASGIWRSAGERRHFTFDRGDKFIIRKPDEIVEDHGRLTAGKFLELKNHSHLVAFADGAVGDLGKESAINQPLPGGVKFRNREGASSFQPACSYDFCSRQSFEPLDFDLRDSSHRLLGKIGGDSDNT